MSYTPNGKAALLLTEMKKRGDGAEVMAQEAAEIMDVSVLNVSQTLKSCVAHGFIHRQKRGKCSVYSLTPFPVEFEQISAQDFSAALWSDGDLIMFGLTEVEGGGFKVEASHVVTLARLLSGVQA
jgi:hypothetical protein